jgi:hypothetical protein
MSRAALVQVYTADPEGTATRRGAAAEWFPHTISAGTNITEFACVADALIAANAATLA